MDPVGRGLSEVLTATIQNVRIQKKNIKKSRKVVPLDPYHMQAEYTVLSAELSKLLDRQERSYQRIFLNTICGQGELLKTTSNILNTIEEMGQTKTKRCHKRKARQATGGFPSMDLHYPTDKVVGKRSSVIFSRRNYSSDSICE